MNSRIVWPVLLVGANAMGHADITDAAIGRRSGLVSAWQEGRDYETAAELLKWLCPH